MTSPPDPTNYHPAGDTPLSQFPHKSLQHLGLHNWPDLPAGQIAVRAGPIMGSADRFSIELRGEPSHPALPHQGNDVLGAAAALVPLLQETFLRRREPRGAALISVTDLVAEGHDHSIPAKAHLRGTIRCLDQPARLEALAWLESAASSTATRFGATALVRSEARCPATVNQPDLIGLVVDAGNRIEGARPVVTYIEPAMTGDDFAYFAQRWPGVYLWLGTGRPGSKPLHDPAFDFNDDVLPVGIALWHQTVKVFFDRQSVT